MRRIMILVSVLVVMLLGGLSVATVAQEGTPPADEDVPEGVAIERLGFGATEVLPATGEFQLVRVVIDPGAGLFRAVPEAGTVPLFYVESGALTLQFDGTLQVTRAHTIDALTTGAAPRSEWIPTGTAVTLEAGDSVVLPSTAAGEIRNDGDEPVVYLAAFVYNPDL